MVVPTLRLERRLLREGARRVAGMDEVGRGAIAGPVSVGVTVVDFDTRTAPSGVRDSKLLSASKREALVPRISRWCSGFAVGHASSEELDTYGLISALRLAGKRALSEVDGLDVVILDGNHDWLSEPDSDAGGPPSPMRQDGPVEVLTIIKADLKCSSVAAASIMAKVTRDQMMVELSRDHPEFNWEVNKGYGTKTHQDGIARNGLSNHHRRSWRIGEGVLDLTDSRDGQTSSMSERATHHELPAGVARRS